MFWSSARLLQHLAQIVTDPTPARAYVESAAIVLHVGNEAYITPHADKDAATQTKMKLDGGKSFTIPAGQFAFLLTEETISIPRDSIGLISFKARLKFKGLVNVSGFHVDPGYSGKIVYSVFNAGPAPIHLEQGMELFTLWLANLDAQASEADVRTKPGFTQITPDIINGIPGEIYSLHTLSRKIQEVENKQNVNEAVFRARIERFQDRFILFGSAIALAIAIVSGVLTFLLSAPIARTLGLQPPFFTGAASTSMPASPGVPTPPGEPGGRP
jgi:dCTP deaminase